MLATALLMLSALLALSVPVAAVMGVLGLALNATRVEHVPDAF